MGDAVLEVSHLVKEFPVRAGLFQRPHHFLPLGAQHRRFEIEEIPVIAEEMATHVLYKLGAEFLRHYCQGIWLKDGHPRFYRHVDGFYTKLLARMEKQELQPALIGQER